MSDREKSGGEAHKPAQRESRKPMTQEEEIEALRKWEEAEDTHNERRRARGKIAELSEQRGKALQDGDEKRVEELTQQIRRVSREIRERFGF